MVRSGTTEETTGSEAQVSALHWNCLDWSCTFTCLLYWEQATRGKCVRCHQHVVWARTVLDAKNFRDRLKSRAKWNLFRILDIKFLNDDNRDGSRNSVHTSSTWCYWYFERALLRVVTVEILNNACINDSVFILCSFHLQLLHSWLRPTLVLVTRTYKSQFGTHGLI